MAYYFLFPESDATIYSQPDRTLLNTGKDEILELVKERGSTDNKLYPSRILVRFSNLELKSVIRDIITHENWANDNSTAHLELTTTEAKHLVEILNIEAYAVSQSWNEGTGKWSNLPTSSNGVSWVNRNNTTIQTQWTTSSFDLNTSGSIISASENGITEGGGTWYTGSDYYATQQMLPGNDLDINMDVTSIVRKWSGSLFNDSTFPTGIENEGFLLKKPDSIEGNVSHSFGFLKYFSVDTHTIHPPKLTFKWDDSSFFGNLNSMLDAHTSSYNANYKSTTDNLQVNLYRNKKEYNQNDTATFRIHVRDKYPTRAFTTTSNYLNVSYINSSSCYSIRDAHTEEEIVPFDDNFTKLSMDSEGMYFKIYMKGLQPERYYRVLIKQNDTDGSIVYDDNYYFKVIR